MTLKGSIVVPNPFYHPWTTEAREAAPRRIIHAHTERWRCDDCNFNVCHQCAIACALPAGAPVVLGQRAAHMIPSAHLKSGDPVGDVATRASKGYNVSELADALDAIQASELLEDPSSLQLPLVLADVVSQSTHRIQIPQYPVSLTATDDPNMCPSSMAGFLGTAQDQNERQVDHKRRRTADAPGDVPQLKFLKVAERMQEWRGAAKRKRFTQRHIEWPCAKIGSAFEKG